MSTGRAVLVGQRRVEHGRGLWNSGSGFLIGGRVVLTAGHLLTEGPVRIQQGPNVYDGEVLLMGDPAQGADLAIVGISDPAFEGPAPSAQLAQVDRSNPLRLENCWVVGFPALKERPDLQDLRDTAHLHGTIAPAANQRSGELEFQVTSTPTLVRQAGGLPSPWEGISGAVVFCRHSRHGDLAVGVVAAHPLREGSSSLSLVPISVVDALPDANRWWTLLGVRSLEDLILLPEGPHAYRSRYGLVVDELARRTPELLDRERDLAALVDFACHGSGYQRLVGAPWSGKTALIAHLVKALASDVDVVPYFLAKRHGDADSARFFAVVSEQLSALMGHTPTPPSAEPGAAREALLSLWREAVLSAEARRRRLVLIVDGLDEDMSVDRGLPSVASMLPTLLTDHTCVLVSSRPAANLDVDLDHPLRSSATPEYGLDPTSHARSLQARADEELEGLLAGTRANQPTSRTVRPSREILSILAAAEAPLSIADLVELTDVNGWDLRRLFNTDLGRVVEIGIDRESRVAFSHDTLRERATARFREYGVWDAARARILSWASDRAEAGWLEGATSTYLLESHPGRLARADPQRLMSLLYDVSFVEAAVRAVGVGRALEVLRAAVVEARLDLRQPIFRLLTQEAKNLSASSPPGSPAALIVQLRNRARMLGLDDLVAQFDARLDELDVSHLRLRWRIPAESPALERSLIGDEYPVRAIAPTLNGHRLVSGDGETLRVWSVETGLHDVIGTQGGMIWTLLATPDSRRAVVTTYDRDMALWDLDRPGQLAILHHVSDVAISSTGLVFAATADQIHVFSADGAEQSTLPTPAAMSRPVIAVDQMGAVLVLGDHTGTVCVWQLDRSQPVTHMLGQSVTTVALSPDARHLVVGTESGSVYAWNPTADEVPRKLSVHSESAVHRLCASDSGIVVASYGGSGGIVSWDAVTGQKLNRVRAEDRLSRPGIAVGAALALTPDGRLAVGGLGAEVVVMETARRGKVRFLRGHGQVILGAAVTADGSRAFSASEDYSIKVWDLESSGPEPPFGSHNDSVSAAAVDSHGRLVATGAGDGIVSVWDVDTGVRRLTINAHDQCEVTSVAWIPTDGGFVTAGLDTTLKFWSEGGRTVHAAELPFLPGSLGVMADGGVALVSREGEVAIYRHHRFETLRQGTARDGVGVAACHLSVDCRRAILLPPEGQSGLILFDVSSCTDERLHADPSWNQAFAYSGDLLAIPRGDEVELWDVNEDLRVQSLGNSGPVRICSVTGSPGVVVTGGWDRTIRAWALHTNGALPPVASEPGALWSCDDEVTTLAISQDGRTAIAGANSGAVLCLELHWSGRRASQPERGSER